MRIICRPIDSDECTWWLVPQERDGLTEEYESCGCIYEREDYRNHSTHDSIGIGTGFKDVEDEFDEEHDEEGDREYTDWNDGDGKRGDTPEFLFSGSGERKVPPRTVNATKDRAKGQKDQGMKQRVGMLMLWNVKSGNMCGVDRE